MAQTGAKQPQARVSGQTIIDELIRNMELGRLEMGYSILLPCIFSVYLHPDDYQRLAGVQDLIREDARRALNARMAEWNGAEAVALPAQRAAQDSIASHRGTGGSSFFADSESSVPPGDVEIHSELNEIAAARLSRRQDHADRPRAFRDVGARRARPREHPPAQPPAVFAEIRYQDESGPQTFFVTQNEICIGRGGEDLWVDLALYTSDEVSREHLRLRRDPSSGAFAIVDKSRNGTWLNGKRLERGVERPLPDRAEIRVAEVLKLSFEVRR